VKVSGSFSLTRTWVNYLTTTLFHYTTLFRSCTDTVILHLTIGQPVTSEFTASGCANYTLPWGTVVTTSGDYSHVYQTVRRCDSTVTPHITIGTGGHSDTTVTACGSFTWNRTGVNYTTSGDYNFTIANEPCTDTVILHSFPTRRSSDLFTASGCANYTLPWGTVVTTSGDYSHVYQTVLGCDSTVTAHITIGTGGHSDTTVTACGSFTWNRTGVNYTTSGDYNFTIANGPCTDTVILHLTNRKTTTMNSSHMASAYSNLPWDKKMTTSSDY